MTDRIKKSDLTHIGKRLPYTVPDGFFEQFEADIWQAVQPDLHCLRARRPLLRRLVWGIVGSVAAALVIGFMLIPARRHRRPSRIQLLSKPLTISAKKTRPICSPPTKTTHFSNTNP